MSIESWQFLIPTIREECSQFFISFNPADEKNSTYQRFIVNTARNVLKIKINYYDNPFFPDVLREELEYDKQYNPDKFKHIWEGECTVMSNAIVFKDKFIVEYFDLENYHGIDFFNGKRLNLKYGMDFGF